MARSGFISADIASTKVWRVSGSLDEARRIIAEALRAGEIEARGNRQIGCSNEKAGNSEKAVDLTERLSRKRVPGQSEEIPPRFWKGLEETDYRRWLWAEGVFFNDNSPTEEILYEGIVLREKDINAIVKRHAPVNEGAQRKRDRRRHPSWDDWVAAITELAFEHQIDATMRQSDLLDRIDAKLGAWGLEPKERPTVAPTASAVLNRWRTNPPVPPVDQRLPGTRKP